MFKIVFIPIFILSFNMISSEFTSEWFVPEENPFTTPPDWENIITSLNNFKDVSNKQDILGNLLNVLKLALCEELEQVPCNNIEENNTKNDQTPITITCVEENKINASKTVEKDRNNITKMELKELVARISSNTNKSKCTEPNNQPSVDVPTMIPIFKPKVNKPSKENCGTKSTSNKEAKERKVNVSPITNAPAFTIPCQRTSDILDGSYLIPKMTYETSKVNLDPNAQIVKSNLQCEKPCSSLATNSISCVESDDVVAMLFKPKTISMMQVYGNLLKKITLTVLVPFYVSKMTL